MRELLVLIFISLAGCNLMDDWDGPGPRITFPGPIAFLPQGMLRGQVEYYDLGESIVSYKGIPYAERKIDKVEKLLKVAFQGFIRFLKDLIQI